MVMNAAPGVVLSDEDEALDSPKGDLGTSSSLQSLSLRTMTGVCFASPASMVGRIKQNNRRRDVKMARGEPIQQLATT